MSLNRLNYTEIHQIFPCIYLGGDYKITNRKYLDKYKIKAIINCIKYSPTSYFLKPYYKYLYIPWDDDPSQNIFKHLDKITNFIHRCVKHNLNILIHCGEGISRSPTAICSYMIKYLRMDVKYSINLLYQKRCVVNPNNGFIEQLHQYQIKNYKLISKHIYKTTKFKCSILYLIQLYLWII